MASLINETANPKVTACWSGVMAMTLCAFALVTSEFMPVSLLTPLSHSLAVTEGMAGQGITIAGIMAVITSLLITSIAGNLNRKTLLLGLTLIMAASGIVVALATGFMTFMAGRALTGIAIGGFWSMSAATAIRLVPPEKVPRALAVFNGGNALATIVAAPIGSFLGSLIGWRWTFFSLVPVACCALIWMWISLPSMPALSGRKSIVSMLSLMGHTRIASGIFAAAAFFMGQFALYTYVRPFLENVTGMTDSLLSLTLLAMGITGFAGTIMIGPFLHRSLYITLVTIPLLMAATATGMALFGDDILFVFFALALWGLVATAAPAGWWTWVARAFPDEAETGGGLMVAIVNLAIATGSVAGGLTFDHSGYRATFLCSAVLLMFAALLAFIAGRQACEKPSNT
ncbi:MFS transporter [Salmonella enterica subsp. enterica serovar Oranienburg]|uniref:MFS transporter n=1 Tax=Salmonella enterica subsp. enterica serovar Sandiego TaxID=1151002 RepID=A0A8E7NDY0_SALET|nr:MFS transporter [Salmonella enterica]ECU0252170.1 MFS transporter [Salmonella enterica subsp. enterica serovar Oranienburg]EDU6968685.1 MFS transporter [Salmonella enterica subsp. enterica serovar Sandiego]EBH0655123.1 MFS transporter [Salmonella enterica]EBN6187367.1 MFS transporter [Salmonella enterica]